MGMYLAYMALAGRILLTGYEKIIFKQVGTGSASEEAVFLIFTTGTVLLAPFLLLVEAPADWSFLLAAALAGLVYTVQTVLYVNALSRGEASLVAPIYYFGLFFLLGLTTVFLGESLGIFKIGGIVLLIYGTSWLNRRQHILASLAAVAGNRACQIMMVSSLLVAVGRTVDGYMVRSVHPITYTFTLCVFTDLFLLIHIAWRGNLARAGHLIRTRWKIGTLAGAVDLYSYLLLLFAITRIEVSIAEPASMLGMIVTVVLARLIFGEQIRDRLLGVVIMIAGAWLLFV